MRSIIFSLLILWNLPGAFAQKVFFDEFLERCSKEVSVYYGKGEIPATGSYILYYVKNDKPYQEYSIVDGKMDGNNFYYDDYGKVVYIGTWSNGEKVSEQHFAYDVRGNLSFRLQGYMKDGLPYGLLTSYWMNGKMKESYRVDGGELDFSHYISCSEFGECEKIWEYNEYNKFQNLFHINNAPSSYSINLTDVGLELKSEHNSILPFYLNEELGLKSGVDYRIDIEGEYNAGLIGFVFGARNSENYNLFSFSPLGIYMFECWGNKVLNSDMNDFAESALLKNNLNIDFSIISNNNRLQFVNSGKIIYSTEKGGYYGNRFGIHMTEGNATITRIRVKYDFQQDSEVSKPTSWKGNGSGFLISQKGYVVTNYHVINGMSVINAVLNDVEYETEVIEINQLLDIAVLRLKGFTSSEKLDYYISPLDDVSMGKEVFTLGYPYALSYLGDDIKYTNGSVSSLSGYQGNKNHFQVSIPIQPGSSGGPLFTRDGRLIGVVNAKFTKGENVSYAIKYTKVHSILEKYLDTALLNSANLTDRNLQDRIEQLKKVSVLIKVK